MVLKSYLIKSSLFVDWIGVTGRLALTLSIILRSNNSEYALFSYILAISSLAVSIVSIVANRVIPRSNNEKEAEESVRVSFNLILHVFILFLFFLMIEESVKVSSIILFVIVFIFGAIFDVVRYYCYYLCLPEFFLEFRFFNGFLSLVFAILLIFKSVQFSFTNLTYLYLLTNAIPLFLSLKNSGLDKRVGDLLRVSLFLDYIGLYQKIQRRLNVSYSVYGIIHSLIIPSMTIITFKFYGELYTSSIAYAISISSIIVQFSTINFAHKLFNEITKGRKDGEKFILWKNLTTILFPFLLSFLFYFVSNLLINLESFNLSAEISEIFEKLSFGLELSLPILLGMTFGHINGLVIFVNVKSLNLITLIELIFIVISTACAASFSAKIVLNIMRWSYFVLSFVVSLIIIYSLSRNDSINSPT